MHHRERAAREAETDQHAGRHVEAGERRGYAHPGEPGGVKQRAEAQHPHRSEAIGDGAGERLTRRPTTDSGSRSRPRTPRVPSRRSRRQRREELADRRTRPERDQMQ